MNRFVAQLDELLGRPVSMRSLGLVRMLVGFVAMLHLWPIVRAALGGDTYHDHFHHPYVSWLPEFGPVAFTVVLLAAFVAAAAMAAGFVTRLSTAATFGVVAYHLSLSTTHVHNNRAYLVAVLLILALASCGRALSVDAWLAGRRGEPLPSTAPAWPLWLLRFECALVYAASGVSKLVDPDWFGGTVTWGRVGAQEAMLRDSIVPSVLADLMLDRSFHTLAAKVIVLTELFIAGGLWWRRTRVPAVLVAIVFHVAIHFGAEVQVFSYLALAVLFVWADPALPRTTVPMVHHRGMSGPRTHRRMPAESVT